MRACRGRLRGAGCPPRNHRCRSDGPEPAKRCAKRPLYRVTKLGGGAKSARHRHRASCRRSGRNGADAPQSWKRVFGIGRYSPRPVVAGRTDPRSSTVAGLAQGRVGSNLRGVAVPARRRPVQSQFGFRPGRHAAKPGAGGVARPLGNRDLGIAHRRSGSLSQMHAWMPSGPSAFHAMPKGIATPARAQVPASKISKS